MDSKAPFRFFFLGVNASIIATYVVEIREEDFGLSDLAISFLLLINMMSGLLLMLLYERKGKAFSRSPDESGDNSVGRKSQSRISARVGSYLPIQAGRLFDITMVLTWGAIGLLKKNVVGLIPISIAVTVLVVAM